MNWLKSLFGRDAGTSSFRSYVETDNPIHGWLEQAGIPWWLSRGEMTARFGVSRQPDRFAQAVVLDVHPSPLDGLMGPLYVQLSENFTPRLPPGEIFGDIYFEDDARVNLQRAVGQLTPVLGDAPILQHGNALVTQWSHGFTRIVLSAFPVELQSEDRRTFADPRFKHACGFSIHPGFAMHPAADEAQGLRTFEVLGACAATPAADVFGTKAMPENAREFIRHPAGIGELQRQIGVSADRKFLIFKNAFLYVVEVRKILSLHIDRLLPARGPGGASMRLECLTDYPGPRSKTISVCGAAAPDDLNDIGSAIAAAIRKPLILGDYEQDV